MKREKSKKIRPYEKLMQVLISGNPVTKDDIAKTLGWVEPRGSKIKGPKIYNISSYVWDIKNIPVVEGRSIVVRSIRNGKKVTAYQIVNVDDAKKYLQSRGFLDQLETSKVEAPTEVSIAKPDADKINKKSGKKNTKKEAA